MTEWVLWTRYPLTAGDQNWFKGLKTHMRLSSVDLRRRGGPSERGSRDSAQHVLRRSRSDARFAWYITPRICRAHPPAMATRGGIKLWMRRARSSKMLGEATSWGHLEELGDRLTSGVALIRTDSRDLAEFLAGSTNRVSDDSSAFSGALCAAHTALIRGDLDLLVTRIGQTLQPLLVSKQTALPHQLRAAHHPAALSVTNAIADSRIALTMLDVVDTLLGKRLIAVLPDAGCGKTQLAAQLTASQAWTDPQEFSSTAGIYMLVRPSTI